MGVARGLGVGNSDEDVPRVYADAVAFSEAEADEIEFKTNADRALSRAKRRRVGGG